MSATPPASGLYAALRTMLADALSMLRLRAELIVVELEEEKQRLLRLLLFAASAFFFLSFGLVMLALFLTVLFWDSHRLLVIGICTGLFLSCGVLALLLLRRHMAQSQQSRQGRRGTSLLAASLQELEQDLAALRGAVASAREQEHEH